MTAPRAILSRESICVTCLSQDRKLFPVNDFKSQAVFLNLFKRDKLCWECNHFVVKVAAFRSRAVRAQALLASALQGHTNVNKISSLSRLACTPAFMDISIIQVQHQEPDPLRIDTIKIESVKEEHENGDPGNTYNQLNDDSCQEMGDVMLPVFNKREAESVDKVCDEAVCDDPLLSVLSKQRELKGDGGFCNQAKGDDADGIANSNFKSLVNRKDTDDIANSSLKSLFNRKDAYDIAVISNSSFKSLLSGKDTIDIANSSFKPLLNRKSTDGIANSSLKSLLNRNNTDDIANATLKSLLSRKNMLIDNPPLAKDSTSTVQLEEMNKICLEEEVMEVEADKQTPTDSDPMYTEKIMSEEEMLEWRERKKNAPYYAVNNPALRCEQCIEPFRRKVLSTAHMRRHEEDYGAFPCHICGVRSLDKSALSVHTSQHYRLLTCKLCGHEWDSPNAMRQHGSLAHGIPVTQWDCDQCERKYPTQEKLKSHVIVHREAACGVCGARVSQKQMQTHMQTHKDVLTCAVCGRKCNGDRALAFHMKTHDTKVDEAAFCVECNMQFRTMTLYRYHLRYTLKHARTDDMPYKCDECGKRFLKRVQLKVHTEMHHSSEPRHKCGVCGEMFKTRKAKRRHERNKHEGVKPAKNKICDHCGKAFAEKSTLLGHINSHTGARPFACRLCDATFGFKSALYLHGRFKHKIKKKNTKKV